MPKESKQRISSFLKRFRQDLLELFKKLQVKIMKVSFIRNLSIFKAADEEEQKAINALIDEVKTEVADVDTMLPPEVNNPVQNTGEDKGVSMSLASSHFKNKDDNEAA